MTISESSQLINKASDQKKLLNSEQIETKSINSLVYATKVAKSLNTAIKHMCPRCLAVILQNLPLDDATIKDKGREPARKTISQASDDAEHGRTTTATGDVYYDRRE